MDNAKTLFQAFEANAADRKAVATQTENLSDNLLAWFKAQNASGIEAFVTFARETQIAVDKPIPVGNGFSFAQKSKDGFAKIQSSSLKSYLSTLRNASQADIAAAETIADLRVKSEDDPRVKAIKKYCAALAKAGDDTRLDEIVELLSIEV